MTETGTIIVWFRQDLRLRDNPAWHAACRTGRKVVPLYIHAPDEAGRWAPGGASKWWLHHSLSALGEELTKKGTDLLLRHGPSGAALQQLVRESGAEAVYWNRCYEPFAIERDKTIKQNLRGEGLVARSFNGSLLWEPWTVATGEGNPYQVFTPFWRACSAGEEPAAPLPSPADPPGLPRRLDSEELDDLGLLPTIDWAGGLRETWAPGERGALRRLDAFCEDILQGYKDDRDRPDLPGTSRLSPHLHHGEISPRLVWHAVREAAERGGQSGLHKGAEAYLRELGWREFSYHLLYHFPHTPETALKEQFRDFPWEEDADQLRAWQKGQTGYPIVDAGMRELWHTGWMHNRVRMIVASFLVKDLLIPWQRGAEWFWDTLVDADLANNTQGWQWAGGCGADAAPYFRIFNPILQGKKFDPGGDYVRRWVPEIAALPDTVLHEPWNAGDEPLQQAGIRLGDTYPAPMVDHQEARADALQAYEAIKKS